MQPTQHIVEIGYNHEQEQDADADIFGTYHEILRRLAARYHLVEQEEHVTTIKCRDGQDVHEGENDAQESCHEPELMPVPHIGEHAAYSSESSKRLGSLG